MIYTKEPRKHKKLSLFPLVFICYLFVLPNMAIEDSYIFEAPDNKLLKTAEKYFSPVKTKNREKQNNFTGKSEALMPFSPFRFTISSILISDFRLRRKGD